MGGALSSGGLNCSDSAQGKRGSGSEGWCLGLSALTIGCDGFFEAGLNLAVGRDHNYSVSFACDEQGVVLCGAKNQCLIFRRIAG